MVLGTEACYPGTSGRVNTAALELLEDVVLPTASILALILLEQSRPVQVEGGEVD